MNEITTIAKNVEWWEVHLAKTETNETVVSMYFRPQEGEEETYVLYNEAPYRFFEALGACLAGMKTPGIENDTTTKVERVESPKEIFLDGIESWAIRAVGATNVNSPEKHHTLIVQHIKTVQGEEKNFALNLEQAIAMRDALNRAIASTPQVILALEDAQKAPQAQKK